MSTCGLEVGEKDTYGIYMVPGFSEARDARQEKCILPDLSGMPEYSESPFHGRVWLPCF